MAFDGANNLYVSITVLNWIIKITTNGVESVFASSGAGGPIVFDSSGNLYSAGDTAIEKISPSGVDLGKFTSGGLNSPSGLAFDRAGNFYVSNGGNTNKIEKFNSAGVDQGIFTTNGLSEPGQMAFDSGGNLYVGDDNKVEIYNSSGQLITYGSVYTPATIDIQPGFLNRPILVIPSPQLSISLSTTNVILSWPTNAAGFTLQTTTNLVSPATWTTVSTTPVVVNTNNRVTNSFFGKSKFYRLSQ